MSWLALARQRWWLLALLWTAAARARHRRLHPAGERPRHVDVVPRQSVLHAAARRTQLRGRLRSHQLATAGRPLRRPGHRRQHPPAVGERRVPGTVRPVPRPPCPPPHDRVRPRPDGHPAGHRPRRGGPTGRGDRARSVVARHRDGDRPRHPRRDRRSDRRDRVPRRPGRPSGPDRRRVGVRRRQRGDHRRGPGGSPRRPGCHRCGARSISPTRSSPTSCARPNCRPSVDRDSSSSAVRRERPARCSTSTFLHRSTRRRLIRIAPAPGRPAPRRTGSRSIRAQRRAHRGTHPRRRRSGPAAP